MPSSRPPHIRRIALRRSRLVVAGALLLASLEAACVSADAVVLHHQMGQTVTFRGIKFHVPNGWRIVSLGPDSHACIRYDSPSVYLGVAGDQAECPAHLIGGAPGLQVEALTSMALSALVGPLLRMPSPADARVVPLPSTGPVGVVLPSAGVLVTLTYGPGSASVMRDVLSDVELGREQHKNGMQAPQQGQAGSGVGVSVPGDYRGLGFDTCTAPSQAAMDAWRVSSDYASVGIYLGGVNMGCAQPNLTPEWVSRQVARGWHVVPVYVGYQAPCSNYVYRMSYDVRAAFRQGRADGAHARVMARKRGIAAPSTLYSDIEGYNSANHSCVAAVISYLTGWTFEMHTKAYQAGVYSSASSGIHDLSLHHGRLGANRPDDLFMAWWNHQADVKGGRYVPGSQWRYRQRVHQYEGETTETHGGHSMLIDRNFLDVSPVVRPPEGCPTNLGFEAYPTLRWPERGEEVRAAQCLLALRGFDPGPANGIFNWRTTAASRAFKASKALGSGTSSIGQYAWTALLSGGPTENLHLGSRGACVRKAQRTLTARLQTTLNIDGVFAETTQAAVRVYQRTVGLAPTGMIGPPTWRALQAGR